MLTSPRKIKKLNLRERNKSSQVAINFCIDGLEKASVVIA